MSLPYDYYPAVLYALDLFGQGHTKTMACDMSNISIATFDKYIKDNPTLQELLIDAEQRGHDAMADALLQPSNHNVYGETNPQMAKIVSDNVKWYLSKKDPKKFGEKIEIKHEITLDRAITEAMDAAKARAQGRVIEDVQYERTPPQMITQIVSNTVEAVADDEELLAELLG